MPACLADPSTRPQGSATEPNDLVRRHGAIAYRLAYDEHALRGGDLDDLAQEALLTLMLAARHFDPSRGFRFSTYAYACIRRRFRDLATRAHTASRLAPGLVPLEGADVRYEVAVMDDSDEPAEADELERLRAFIAVLSPVQRATVRAVFLDGLTVRAAAKRLDVNPSNVHQTIARAIARLARWLGADPRTATGRGAAAGQSAADFGIGEMPAPPLQAGTGVARRRRRIISIDTYLSFPCRRVEQSSRPCRVDGANDR